MSLRIAAAAALFTLTVACGSTVSSDSVALVPVGWESFGADLTTTDFTPLDEVLSSADKYDGQSVAIEAVANDVCSKKGCWMTLSSDAVGDETVRVTFQDYGFFVPLDSTGKTARLQGTFEKKVVPIEDVKHYLKTPASTTKLRPSPKRRSSTRSSQPACTSATPDATRTTR